ncbi:DUF1272 domain-containing protein [uncultured Kordia sp.]|uniref:DUF1272 domain-containing protein n=1 Tax=uncultured Kordia sp. TaxID=507699 RepID=UPI00344BEB15
MLEIRRSCEHCDKDIPFDATAVFICTFECIYYKECVTTILHNTRSNCEGNFTKRQFVRNDY